MASPPSRAGLVYVLATELAKVLVEQGYRRRENGTLVPNKLKLAKALEGSISYATICRMLAQNGWHMKSRVDSIVSVLIWGTDATGRPSKRWDIPSKESDSLLKALTRDDGCGSAPRPERESAPRSALPGSAMPCSTALTDKTGAAERPSAEASTSIASFQRTQIVLGPDGPVDPLPPGSDWIAASRTVRCDSNLAWTVIVIGDGDGSVIRTGDGAGHAVRAGTGDGDAVRDGRGLGDAVRKGIGYGNAYRTGDGDGNALRDPDPVYSWRPKKGYGDAIRAGRGAGHAIRSGAGAGEAIHNGPGPGDAIHDGSTGNAIRAGTGLGNALRDGGGVGNAYHRASGPGDAYRRGTGHGMAHRSTLRDDHARKRAVSKVPAE